jgi:hypothetical protein
MVLTMRTRARGRWWRASVAAVVVLAACGSRVPTARPPTTPAVTATPSTPTSTDGGGPTTTVPTVTTAGTAPPSTTATTAPFDQTAATAQITATWEKFFTPGTSVDERVALLQNGAALRAAIEQFATNPLQQQVSAKVTQVTFNSPTEAMVTYDVSLNGTVALPAALGKAVLEGGTWKVAQASFCSLLSLAASGPVPGCS